MWREIQARKTRRAMDADPAPMWISILRMAVMVGVIVFAALRFASGRRHQLPDLRHHPAGAGHRVLLLHPQHGRRPAHLRGRRQLRAAELSGVKLKRVNFFVMMNMSVLAALAGMIFVARSQASGPQDGNGWELDAIAAVFIGGAAVAGGIGTISGSIVGGLVMAVLNNGLQLQGVGTDKVQIIKGLVLLLAVAIDVYNKSQGRFSIIGSLMRPFRRDDSAPPPDAEREPAKVAVSG
ncbi:hypothetical protein NKG94_20800 [Micromonospora sp. M12]